MQSNKGVLLLFGKEWVMNFIRQQYLRLRKPALHIGYEPLTLVLLLFGLIQLVGITDPPLEMAHSWRQSFTAMITRNFWEGGLDLLHPRIDMAGEKSGIVGAEFPLFNFLSWVLCKTFGYQHWYGRCVNLVVVILGAYHFYHLLRNRFSENISLFSVIILLCSSWFTFSRKIMPDTFSVSLVLVGLRYGFDFWHSGRWVTWLWSTMAIAMGILSKIPAMSLLAVVGLLLFVKVDSKKRVMWMVLGTVTSLLPAIWWYFSWVPHLNTIYGYHLFFPKGLLEGWREIRPLWRLLLEKFYFTSYYSFLALLLGAFGVGAIILRKLKLEAMALASIALVFGLFILKTGAVFPLHTYYSIPFIPVMALLSGLGLDYIYVQLSRFSINVKHHKTILFGLLLSVVIEAVSNQIHDHFIKPTERYKQSLETEIASVIPMDSKVVFVSSASPQELFLLHRKGWTIYPEQITRRADVSVYRTLGANFVVINKSVLSNFHAKDGVLLALDTANRFYESPHYIVFRLNTPLLK